MVSCSSTPSLKYINQSNLFYIVHPRICIADEQVQLHAVLTTANLTQMSTVQFLIPEEVPHRHAQDQHIIFVVDLNCPGIKSYFKKVKDLI